MADGYLSLGLLKDVVDLFERLQSTVMLTKEERNEILESVQNAVIETELVFGKSKSRKVVQDENVAKAWSKAGQTILKHLPNEDLGNWLQNKGEACANPDKWSSAVLKENRLQIEEIKERVKLLTKTKRKIFRPDGI